MSRPEGPMTAVERAIVFATNAHAGQKRKGKSTPYIWHPLRVAATLLEAGAPERVVVAGLLHDTLEDTSVVAEDIERAFGPEVLAIVRGASEPDKGAPWEERKRRTIETARHAPADVRLVEAADKLDNARTMAIDLARDGEAVWARFKRGRKEQEWYYRSLLASLREDCPPEARSIVERFGEMVALVFG